MSKWIVDIHGDIEGDYDLICKAESIIPLAKVKQAREEIIATNDSTLAIIEIMDSLIAESEEQHG